MMKRHLCLLVLPLLSIAACLDMSDQDAAEGASSQASVATPDPGRLAGSPQPDAVLAIERVCETFGAFCVGAPTIAFEDPVVETAGGRILQIVSVAGGVNLAFNADPTRCVAVKNASTLVEVRACTVASAVWKMQNGPDGHSCLFQNQLGGFLSGPGNGGRFNVVSRGASGWLQQYTVPGFCGG